MARIDRFEEQPMTGSGRHTRVVCGYRWFDIDGERILQLDTYGSADRAMPGKVSQSIQIDREGAAQLKRLLERAFEGL